MKTKEVLIGFLAGVLFAVGLAISGMSQPKNVLGFLDITGDWQPQLMFVMMGAIGVYALAFHLSRGYPKPALSDAWHLPSHQDLTMSLVFGAAIFGIGWGLAGYCPGPAIASLGSGNLNPWIFVGGLLLGITAAKILQPYFFKS